jgi:hypothetical protein
MFINEAKLLYRELHKHMQDINSKKVIVVIGSGSANFREVIQPHIFRNIYRPFTQDPSVSFINLDFKKSVGVDYVSDILNLDPKVAEKICNANIYLVSNLLEHVVDVKVTINKIAELMGQNSILICSGPVDYPYHPDPIDNHFRPKTAEDFEEKLGYLRLDSFNIYSNNMNYASNSQGLKQYLFAIYQLVKSYFSNPRIIMKTSDNFKRNTFYIAIIRNIS